MEKFIYVFSEDDKNILLSYGYKLLKSDDRQNIYIFENKNDQRFSAMCAKVIYSNTLTF